MNLGQKWNSVVVTDFWYPCNPRDWLIGFMVLNTTFDNISAISWQSALLVEETGGPGENHWPAASHWQTLSRKWHNVYRAQGLTVHIVRHQIYNYINNDSATCTSQIWLKIKELAPHYWLHMIHIAENKADCHKEWELIQKCLAIQKSLAIG